MPDTNKPDRAAAVLREVLAERAAQRIAYTPEHDDALTLPQRIAIAARHLGLAAGDGTGCDDPGRARRQFVRLAALCLAWVESLDRLSGREYPVPKGESGPGY